MFRACLNLPGFLAMTFLIFSGQALAEREVGNGGVGVACFDVNGALKSIEVYDYFEARILNRATIDLGDPNADYRDQANVALRRLERLSPLRAQRYREQILRFEEDSNFLEVGMSLPLIPDVGAIQLPDGCQLVQVVRQETPRFPDDQRFIVDSDLWLRMSERDKAGLVLHEVIYRETLIYGHETSVGTRRFNALISQKKFESYSYEKFYEFIRAVPLVQTDLMGAQFTIGQCRQHPSVSGLSCPTPEQVVSWMGFEFFPSGNIKRFVVTIGVGGNEIGVMDRQLRIDSLIFNNQDSGKLSQIEVGFRDTLTPGLHYLKLSDSSGSQHMEGESPMVVADWLKEIVVADDGKIQSVTASSIHLKVQDLYANGKVSLRRDGTVEAFEGGSLYPLDFKGYAAGIHGTATVDRQLNWEGQNVQVTITVPNPTGEAKVTAYEDHFEFDNQGRVKSALASGKLHQAGITPCYPWMEKLLFGGIDRTTFHPNGHIESTQLFKHSLNEDAACVIDKIGNRHRVPFNARTWFDADGWWVRSDR